MPISCFIESDLGSARLIGDAADGWTALPRIGDQPPDVEALRARAVQAADWVASGNGARRRLSLVCIGVSQSDCIWLRAPSIEEPVLAASLRTAVQDWGDRACTGSVEPLMNPLPAARPEQKGFLAALRRPVGKPASPPMLEGCVVLGAPLSLARLWLDDLDARNVRTEAVLSLWHAMALSWGEDSGADHSETSAILLHEPGRGLIWCWARGRDLLVGGSAMEEPPAAPNPEQETPPETNPPDRIAQRVSLDWLTWSAHLGTSPASIVIIGDGTGPIRQRLSERLPSVPVREVPTTDTIAETVRRAAEKFSPATDLVARRCLLTLTKRPNRAVRTHYRWAAAALVLLAAAVGILGFRMNRATDVMREAARQAEAESRSLVESLNEPGLLASPNLVKALESRVMTLRAQEPPKPPPEPKPIIDVIRFLSEHLAEREGVRLYHLSLDVRQPNTLQISVPDRRTGEEILLSLQQNSGAMGWATAGGGTDQMLRLNGNWIR